MPDFTFSSPDGKSYTVSGPEGATAEQAFGMLQKQIGTPSVAADVAKSAGIGIAKGPINALGFPGDIQSTAGSDYNPFNYLTKKYKEANPERAAANEKNAAQAGLGEGMTGETRLPTSADIQSKVEGITGEFYKPQTRAGKIAEAVTSTVANPISYAGPGGAALKVGGAALSGAASEGGRQAAEGTKYEIPAQIAGSLLGGVAGAKTLGPAAERAAVPTIDELKAAATRGYDKATASGLELHPQGVANIASGIEQDLVNTHAHTGGQYGTAPKTLAVLDELQNPPAGATITAANLSTIRKNLGRIAGETNEGRPTPDAHAASVALEHLRGYTENIPASHVLAGDAPAYANAIREANANYAAMARSRTIDTKLTRAENNAAGGIHTSPDNQIKSQIRQILNNPKQQRGFSREELAAMDQLNRGTVASNSLRQVGRAGAGVVPMMAHALAAVGTGGASVGPSLAIGVPLYAVRKIAERLTRGQANRLDEMIRSRSPEFQQRASRVPHTSNAPHVAAIARALATGAMR